MKNMKMFFVLSCFLILLWGQGLYAEEDIPENGKSTYITIDNDYSDWEKIPSFARFSSYYSPYHFNREIHEDLEILEIKDSSYWGHNGTRLKEVKALLVTDKLYLYFSTLSPIADGLLIFLYLYKGRCAGDPNFHVLELNIEFFKGTGKIYLWELGVENSIEVGSIAVRPNRIEAVVDITLLPKILKAILIPYYSCDLTTCFYEKTSGTYEEFYFTSFYFRDIPTPDDL